jgi:hypothetical protein
MRRKIVKQVPKYAGSYDYYYAYSTQLKRRCLWVHKEGYLHNLITNEKFEYPKIPKKKGMVTFPTSWGFVSFKKEGKK